ncbi:hypothetical protein L798_10275 [Zootermopsis nevadensis]|uniref:Uncharacterized protein n=1 Tax=Zootermopsis nevadensis TaxID=136037 RepID=A0A067R0K5_ZOONE|nr:hypothetical protein L798_10275 [Zootermopsis nevadensis]
MQNSSYQHYRNDVSHVVTIMYGKQLRGRTVGLRMESSGNSEAETEIEMPCGQLVSEASSSEIGNSILRTEDDPENSGVNTREGTGSTGDIQQTTIGLRNTETLSSNTDSLLDFIANTLRSLKEDNVKWKSSE